MTEPTFTLLIGDVLDQLATLPDESVHCVVTSPPYWGLRDYGTGSWEGGDPGCDHQHETKHQVQGATSARAGRSNTESQRNENFREVCGRCGARRVDQQLGLEATPGEYVARMVAVFREVRRVLRSDGTCWLNIGDSYASDTAKGGSGTPNGRNARGENYARPGLGGLKPKNLVGIPWRLAFALQADGWWLRSEIIWSKPNPMPESVTDRPTKSHEQVFLLTKSARYFYDADAVREPHSPDGRSKTSISGAAPGVTGHENHANREGAERWPGSGRNLRSVWTISTEPYPEAHFATFPTALVEPCVKAGCPEGGTVLDPFLGSGTTAVVALRLGRDCIGIELNEEYAALARRRVATYWKRPARVQTADAAQTTIDLD